MPGQMLIIEVVHSVLQTAQMNGVLSDVYSSLLCALKNPRIHSIGVGHIALMHFNLPYGAILP